jgi:hypothetical protein
MISINTRMQLLSEHVRCRSKTLHVVEVMTPQTNMTLYWRLLAVLWRSQKSEERMNKFQNCAFYPFSLRTLQKGPSVIESLYDAYPIAVPILLQLASLTHDDLSGKSPYELDLSDVSNVYTGRIEVCLIGFLSALWPFLKNEGNILQCNHQISG